ncbi:MAG: hypothetical protein IPH46_17125 [Bacteroidetes bacterium]|nr:hypothetical protein [Bacteroidota bacterium]
MPDDDARSGASELLHIGLVNMGNVCTQNFQFLKGYIDTAFTDPAVQKVQYVIAGQNYYRDATRGDWEAMVSMNTSAKNYLANAGNVTALTAGLNMPPAFVTTKKQLVIILMCNRIILNWLRKRVWKLLIRLKQII